MIVAAPITVRGFTSVDLEGDLMHLYTGEWNGHDSLDQGRKRMEEHGYGQHSTDASTSKFRSLKMTDLRLHHM